MLQVLRKPITRLAILADILLYIYIGKYKLIYIYINIGQYTNTHTEAQLSIHIHTSSSRLSCASLSRRASSLVRGGDALSPKPTVPCRILQLFTDNECNRAKTKPAVKRCKYYGSPYHKCLSLSISPTLKLITLRNCTRREDHTRHCMCLKV